MTAAAWQTMRLPMRAATQPANGIATRAPSAMVRSASPSAPSLRPRLSCTAGMRETQVAKRRPLIKKSAATAQRAFRRSVQPSVFTDGDGMIGVNRTEQGGRGDQNHTEA